MTPLFKPSAAAFAVMTGITSVSDVQAAETRLQAKYTISYLGLSVGKMKNSLRVDETNYSLVGTMKTNAVVAIVADTKAQFSAKGSFRAGNPVPKAQSINFRQRKKKGFVKIAFANGSVVNRSVKPKIKYKKGAAKLENNHIQNVIDPISALVFPVAEGEVGNGKSVCNRTLPIFDGKNRVNLKLSFKSKAVRSADGFKGEVFTCAIRYQPVAGMRLEGKSTRFMKANRDLEISMARVGQTNVYALYSFRVKTRRGTASGKAYSFKAS
jgi:hypothetical protein